MKTVITKNGKLAVEITSDELRNMKKKFEDLHNRNPKYSFEEYFKDLADEAKRNNSNNSNNSNNKKEI